MTIVVYACCSYHRYLLSWCDDVRFQLLRLERSWYLESSMHFINDLFGLFRIRSRIWLRSNGTLGAKHSAQWIVNGAGYFLIQRKGEMKKAKWRGPFIFTDMDSRFGPTQRTVKVRKTINIIDSGCILQLIYNGAARGGGGKRGEISPPYMIPCGPNFDPGTVKHCNLWTTLYKIKIWVDLGRPCQDWKGPFHDGEGPIHTWPDQPISRLKGFFPGLRASQTSRGPIPGLRECPSLKQSGRKTICFHF